MHCQGKVWELRKGDSFTSETKDADIMLDIQDARVLLQWPRQGNKIATPVDSDSPWDDENSPRPVRPSARRTSYQSPLRQRHRLQSPVSPSPAANAAFPSSTTFFASDPPVPVPVQVYEDENSEDEADQAVGAVAEATQSTQKLSQPLSANLEVSQSSSAALSNDFSDFDEENDPVVHSFGPFGSNLMPRFESFTTKSPEQRPALKSLQDASVPSPKKRCSSESVREEVTNPIINHVINQLAYSRLSSTPLSTLMDHLPSHFKVDSPGSKENQRLTTEALKKMLDKTSCIGEVEREGKDAAGKRLESEYYYIPEMDNDLKRKDAVVEGLMKPGLRACRKQHKVRSYTAERPKLKYPSFTNPPLKQYFWRKPK